MGKAKTRAQTGSLDDRPELLGNVKDLLHGTLVDEAIEAPVGRPALGPARRQEPLEHIQECHVITRRRDKGSPGGEDGVALVARRVKKIIDRYRRDDAQEIGEARRILSKRELILHDCGNPMACPCGEDGL